MKKKTKNKKGGYPYCYGYEDPDAFCRERAENGPTEEDEFTVCDTNTGNCVKPMGDVNRRRLRQQQQEAIDQEEEEAEEQRINENLVNEFDEELFGDNVDYGGGGRKIFRRKQKKKIGGYNSCSGQEDPDAYCRRISESGPWRKGKTHCNTETGYCIEPLSDTERKKRNKQRTEALLKKIREEREARDEDDDDDDIDMDDLFGSDSEDESNYKTSKPVKLYRKKQSSGNSNLDGGKKKSRKKLRKKRKKTRRKHKRKSKSRKKRKSRKK